MHLCRKHEKGNSKVFAPKRPRNADISATLVFSTAVYNTAAVGTIGYAAPEQCDGSEQPTERTDIYSFGAILHHLISGRNPSNDPFYFPPLNLAQYGPGGKELSTLIEQMTKRDAKERPSSVEDVKQKLEFIKSQFLQLQESTQITISSTDKEELIEERNLSEYLSNVSEYLSNVSEYLSNISEVDLNEFTIPDGFTIPDD